MSENGRKPKASLPLKFYEDSLTSAREVQADHSKWLINTLYLLHSGAIAGLLARVPIEKISTYSAPLTFFVMGLCFTFLAGFATWLNYHLATYAYFDVLQKIRRRQWKLGYRPRIVVWVAATQWIALAIGLLSFASLIMGAYLILDSL